MGFLNAKINPILPFGLQSMIFKFQDCKSGGQGSDFPAPS